VKRDEVVDLLTKEPELSNREVGRRTKTPESTVRKLRAEVNGNGNTHAAVVSSEGLALGEAHHLPDGEPPGVRRLKASELDLDSGTRIRELDQEYVQEMAEAMEDRKGVDDFPPLRAFWVPDLEHYVLTRGFHRLEASIRVLGDDPEWAVDVHLGDLTAAIEDAFQDNRTHGLRLTHHQRAEIIRRILADGRWDSKSDRAIAKVAGEKGDSGRKFVQRVRKEWLKQQGKERPETVEVERDGKTHIQPVPRGRADQAQGDDVGDHDAEGESEADAEVRAREVEQEYLRSIKMRENLHPSLLENFDKDVMADRKLDYSYRMLQNWLLSHRDVLGEEHPYYDLVNRLARIPRPHVQGDDRQWRHQWTACQACVVDGLTTGKKDDKVCESCSGTGINLKMKRA
jgi:hypothetical protein